MKNNQLDKTTLQKGVQGLTRKEKQIMLLAGEGLTHKEIAHQLFNSPETIRTHLKHIYRKLDVNNRIEAVKKLRTEKITPFGELTAPKNITNFNELIP